MFWLFLNILFFNYQDNLSEQVSALLKSKLLRYDRIEFEIITLPKGEISSVKIQSDKEINVSGEFAYIPVEIFEKSRKSTSLITCRVKLFKKVYVVNRKVVRGEVLNKSVFDFKEMNVTRLNDNYLINLENISGFRARMDIREGTIIVKDNIEPLPVIRVDDRVTAFFSKGNVEISFEALAKQEGLTGDVIRIITSEKRYYRAKILDSITVKIIE